MREAGLELPIICLTVPQKPITIGEGMGETRVLSMPFSGYDFMHLLQEMHDAAPGARARVDVARLRDLRRQGRRRHDDARLQHRRGARGAGPDASR